MQAFSGATCTPLSSSDSPARTAAPGASAAGPGAPATPTGRHPLHNARRPPAPLMQFRPPAASDCPTDFCGRRR